MFGHIFLLTAPLFLLVLLGYGLLRWARWPPVMSDVLTRFVFSVAIPALLFRMMSGISRLPPPDWRLLIVFFGSCFVVFALGRLLGRLAFGMDGVSQSVFGLGGIFSNLVLLGLPLSRLVLGDEAVPAASLIILFNALVLWTLVSVSVEWARNRSTSLAGLGRTARDVLTNPIVASIVVGTAFGFTGLALPAVVDRTLGLVAEAAAPLALIALGMGLATYELRAGWKESLAVCALKLIAQPVMVYLLARALDLSALQTQVIVLLAACPTGANVYLMARQFKSMEAAIASSMVLSTLLASVSIPVTLALLAS
jgi:malonate transporter and related proteins